ncbi:MAG: molybdenum cofactor guanylyltransferase MobA [Pseudomonadota bacterium]
MSPDPDVAGIILAGGRGRRLGERDKGLVELAGRPLVAHVLDRLRPQVAESVISANRHLDVYARFGVPVVADELPDQPGPLAGLLAAARQCRRDWLLCVPCDTPWLPTDLARRLRETAARAGVALVRAADPERVHFAVMLLHRDRLVDLAQALADGERRVQGWQARLPSADCRFPDPRAFFNINTETDLAEAGHLVDMKPGD